MKSNQKLNDNKYLLNISNYLKQIKRIDKKQDWSKSEVYIPKKK